MMKQVKWWAILALLAGCQQLTPSLLEQDESVRRKPIARVLDTYLYEDELEGLIPSRATQEDSANIVQRYVDTWIRKQLMLTKASENLTLDQADIERRVQDYRYQLIVHSYQKKFVEQNLDTAISREQILAYYDANKENFELKKNIVKAIYLKIPKEAPQATKVKRWMYTESAKDTEELTSYAYSYADKFVLNDSIWVEFDDLVAGTPFTTQINNVVNTLKTRNFLETSDDNYLYYLRIREYKLSENEFAPIELVADQLRNILLNRRKIELQKAHENSIYEAASREGQYEIF